MGPIQPFETAHDWEGGWGGGAVLRPLQQSGQETVHLPQSSAEVKNVWTYTSTSGTCSRHGRSLSSGKIKHFTFLVALFPTTKLILPANFFIFIIDWHAIASPEVTHISGQPVVQRGYVR